MHADLGEPGQRMRVMVPILTESSCIADRKPALAVTHRASGDRPRLVAMNQSVHGCRDWRSLLDVLFLDLTDD